MNDREKNGLAIGGRVAVIDTSAELAAQDSLGPLARAAIYEAPICVLAVPIVSQINAFNEKRASLSLPLVDVRRADVDAGIARAVRDESYQRLKIDCDEHDAQVGMKPLRRLNRVRAR